LAKRTVIDCAFVHDTLLDTAIRAARAGGDELLRFFRRADLSIGLKGDNDFVTEADRASEAAVAGLIRSRHPDHHLLGEEGGVEAGGLLASGSGDVQWIIDPLDGTTNFLQGLPVFAVSIGCRRGAELVAGAIWDPLGENLFTGTRGGGAFWNGRRMRVATRQDLAGAFLATGYPFRAKAALDTYLEVFREVFLQARAIRRCGSAALDLAYTAAGVYDGFFEFRLSPWDIAAGALLIEEAGGELCDLDGGGRYLHSGNLLAGCAGVVAGLREAVSKHASEARLEELVPWPTSVAGLLC
jgi:myo-inositol-1(or 4)-monophosphatase